MIVALFFVLSFVEAAQGDGLGVFPEVAPSGNKSAIDRDLSQAVALGRDLADKTTEQIARAGAMVAVKSAVGRRLLDGGFDAIAAARELRAALQPYGDALLEPL